MSKAQSNRSEGVWIDPPSGWKYGFPKLMHRKDLNDKGLNFHDWLIAEGYPAELIHEFGEHFYVRSWDEFDGELGI